jgi:ubiquinone/menaquinone biosynthesis C-methylase UbiE
MTRLLGIGSALQVLIDQADIRSGACILDLGCGTGSLAIRLAQQYPDVTITALDPDPHALTRARRKADRAGVHIKFVKGFGDTIPSADATFDRVTSSFMLHHLTQIEQLAALREVRRVLAPDGSLHIADFVPGSGGERSRIARLLHRESVLHDEDVLTRMLTEAGMTGVERIKTRTTLFGPIGYFRGCF